MQVQSASDCVFSLYPQLSEYINDLGTLLSIYFTKSKSNKKLSEVKELISRASNKEIRGSNIFFTLIYYDDGSNKQETLCIVEHLI